MPDFEPRPATVPSFVPPVRTRSTDDDELDLITGRLDDEIPPQREGLPPGYRMRADPHYVEQLTSRVSLPQVRAVRIGDIEAPHPIDPEGLEPLVQSIAAHGVLQPVILRSVGGRYELIAGARRVAAASRAGLSHVPCIVCACDDAHARALGEAADVRVRREPAPRAAPDIPAAALKEVARSLSTIESCLQLLEPRESVLRERVALDLVRCEAERASRFVQCLAALSSQPRFAPAQEPLEPLLREVIDGFRSEMRLSGASLTFDAAGAAQTAFVDREAIALALAAAIGAMLAMVQHVRSPQVHVRLTAPAGSPNLVEIDQQACVVAPSAAARAFDLAWTDRPGGYQAAVELSAARWILELHRGTLEMLATGRPGCRLVMTVPSQPQPR